jgi:GT2 family glycosyltransferase
MKIWICIPVFNRIQYTLNCLATLKKQTFTDFTVVICDHGSTDGTSERIKHEFPDVIVLNADSSLWWTGAINRCVSFVLQHAGTDDYLLTLNNDVELPIDYLSEFVSYTNKYPLSVLASATHDIATSKLVSVGTRQNWITAKAEAVTFEQDHLPDDDSVVSITHTSGRGTLFPIGVFREIGLYDERHLHHYGADFDFSHKARRAGFPVYVCKRCKVFSYVDATGMTAVRNQLSLKSFINYFTSTRSPANLKVRWWIGWNNCPKGLLPIYMVMDIIRITCSYFRYFIVNPKVS